MTPILALLDDFAAYMGLGTLYEWLCDSLALCCIIMFGAVFFAAPWIAG